MVTYFHVFSPIIGLGINVVGQLCISRYANRFSLLKSIFVGFIIGTGSLLSIELYYLNKIPLPPPENISSVFVNIITYSALGYCYFHFINLGETARRIRLLRELMDSSNGLTIDEILQHYNSKEIIERRLDRLIKNGQVICKNNRYYTGKSVMLLIAKIITALKFLLLGKKSEFD